MPNSRFLELVDDVGLAPSHTVSKKGLEVPNDGTHGRPAAGEPEPLASIRVNIPVPVEVAGEVIADIRSIELKPSETFDDRLFARILPNSRIVECRHPALVDALLGTGHYREVDPPKSEQPRTPREKQPSAPAGGEES
jgi:hypothetical protein